MTRRTSLCLLGLVLMLLAGAASAAQVTAAVDRSTVHMGDTLTLNITVTDGGGSSEPDFDPLRKDFDVLQSSSSSNFSFINGKSSSTRVWGVALRPTHTGTIIIPSLDVAGAHTQPVAVTVLAASTGAQGGPGDDAFVETSVEPLSVYVGQQALYRVRLFYAAGQVPQGNLQQPKIDGVDVRQLGKAEQYQTQRGGRSYNVVERDYALIAGQPGTVSLPAISFQGQLGTGSGFPGFASNMRNVNVRSPSLSWVVKTKPASAPSGPWLPAQAIDLTASGLPSNGQATVGEPITLTLTEQAKGLPFEDLPPLTLPDIAGAEVYPDKPDASTDDDGHWLYGKRQRSFAIVPTRAGRVTIPAISLNWWDVTTDKPAVITVPGRTLTVAAAAGSGAATATPPTPAPATGAKVASAQVAPPVIAGSSPVWRWIAIVLLALWLATLLAWWWRSRLRSSREAPTLDAAPQQPNVRHAHKAFRQALASGDGAALARTLQAWAQAERPALRNLGELAAALADADQQQAIAALERSRYGNAAAEPDRVSLGKAFARDFAWAAPAHGDSAGDALPPLYPFGHDEGRAM